MATRIRVRDRKIVFSSLSAESFFFDRAEGKDVLLTIDDRPSREIMAYFEGCLVPAFFYWHPNSGWKDFRDARDVLKAEFLPTRSVRTLKGDFITAPPSMGDLGKERYAQLCDTVVNWMIESGMPAEVLDSAEYVRWRDSAQAPGVVYPPIERLRESYTSQCESNDQNKKAHEEGKD